jgi:hypothetical protein
MYLKARGVQMRPGGHSLWNEQWREEAARRYVAGESQQKIADSLGVNQGTVSGALRTMGIEMRKVDRRREDHGSWKGGRLVDTGGYIRVILSDDDRALIPKPLNGAYALEHRLVMARALGRPLTKSESVHHINGDHADNRLENLELRQGAHGKGVRMVCLACGSHNIEARTLA